MIPETKLDCHIRKIIDSKFPNETVLMTKSELFDFVRRIAWASIFDFAESIVNMEGIDSVSIKHINKFIKDCDSDINEK